jgi:PmbA protein
LSGTLDLAADVLARAEGEAQVTVMREHSLTARFARSAPTQCTEVDAHAVHVLCVVDGHTGGATAATLDRDALERAVRAARAAAEASARHGEGSYPGLPGPAPARGHDGFDLETARLSPEPAGDALAAAFGAAAEHGLQAFGLWTAGAVETAIVSTTGVSAVDRVTDAYMKVLCRDADGRSGFAAGAGTGVGAIDAAALTHRAARKVVPDAEPAVVPPGEYPVVLEPDAVGTVLDMLAMLAFNGLAHAEGRGALVDRLGTRVAAPNINLSDSPRFRGTLPRAFDAEGVPKAPLPLIQDGVAHRVVHDTRSAAVAQDGAASTGHATAPGGDPEGPVPTNLVLIGGGAADVDELAAPVERGLYVTRLWYVNAVHERSALLTGMTRDGTFLIEDGRITRPARDVRFTDSALRILAATEALTASHRLVTEGEFYGRRFATGSVCPALRAQGFRVTGGS